MKPYLRFVLMISISTALMWALMYANVYSVDHLFWSETRLYMALLMGAIMLLVMLAFMRGMYPSRAANAGLVGVAVVVFGVALYLVRSQVLVEDVAWMKAMIPHHSIAILTSERARLTDPRVRELAQEIVESQRREIAQMRALVAEIEGESRTR
jgi:hypothetical protein